MFNLIQRFLFYIRDFIWIITLAEKSKFDEIVNLKVYCNLKRFDINFLKNAWEFNCGVTYGNELSCYRQYPKSYYSE